VPLAELALSHGSHNVSGARLASQSCGDLGASHRVAGLGEHCFDSSRARWRLAVFDAQPSRTIVELWHA
jgi:hypothetical protein